MSVDNLSIRGRTQNKSIYFCTKKCIQFFLQLTFNLPLSTLHWSQHTCPIFYSTVRNILETSLLWCLNCAFFSFTSAMSAKRFPFMSLFIWGNTNSRRGLDRMSGREERDTVVVLFLVKNQLTERVVYLSRCTLI